MNNRDKPERFIRYFDSLLWLRVDGKEASLGKINTRIGGLTRQQKLKAVEAQGEWVRI